MLNISGSTLCIVASPFQCLCMMEALEYFHIVDYDVVVGYSDELSLSKIHALLTSKKIDYKKIKIAHVIKDVIAARREINKRYSNFIIADFDNRNGYSLACLLSEPNATVCFVDDGVQAYQYFSNPPIRLKHKFSVRIVFALYSLVGNLKRIRKPIYFTVYDVSSNEYKIIRNNLILIKNEIKKQQADVFIIGTNSSALEFEKYSYYDYLDALINYIKKEYVNNTIYYCPHRRDKNNERIAEFCSNKGVLLYDTKISVECDFIDNGLNPRAIIGFNSNALYTLHILYPESDCKNISFQLSSESEDKENKEIARNLSEKGIALLQVI